MKLRASAPFAALSLPLARLAVPYGDTAKRQPVVLIPDGQFNASDGRPQGLPGWRLDAAIAARLIRRVQGRKTKLVVNYEHAEPTGPPCPPPAGSTPPAWPMSPVIRYDATSGAVLDLLLALLTNTPALDVLPTLSARLRLVAEDLDDDANDRLTPLSPALIPPEDSPMPLDLAQLREGIARLHSRAWIETRHWWSQSI